MLASIKLKEKESAPCNATIFLWVFPKRKHPLALGIFVLGALNQKECKVVRVHDKNAPKRLKMRKNSRFFKEILASIKAIAYFCPKINTYKTWRVSTSNN